MHGGQYQLHDAKIPCSTIFFILIYIFFFLINNIVREQGHLVCYPDLFCQTINNNKFNKNKKKEEYIYQ